METIQYVTDTKGNNTGLLIDLLNPRIEKIKKIVSTQKSIVNFVI